MSSKKRMAASCRVRLDWSLSTRGSGIFSGHISWSIHAHPRTGIRVGAIPDNGCSIDEDIADALGQLVRIGVGGVIDNRVRVENHDIGEHAFPEESAIPQSEAIGDGRAGLADGVLQG